MPLKRAASSLLPMAYRDRPIGVACRTTAVTATSTSNGTTTTGMPVSPMELIAHAVQARGKSATAWSPRTTNARPRYRASVPIVTASEGSPTFVTRKPLKAPRTAPRSRTSGRIDSSGRPANQSLPMTALDSPTMLATERSISPVMTMSVSGRAMSAITTTSSSRKPTLRVEAKPSIVTDAITRNSTRKVVITLPEGRVKGRRAARAPAGAGLPATGDEGVVSTATEVPPSEARREPEGERPVEGDRADDQCADRGVPPERVDADRGGGDADRGEQQRAERGPVDGAAAAEDGHPADDAGGDHEQLLTGARRGVQRQEPGCVHDSGEPGERTVDDEGGEHPSADRDTGEPGRLGRRPDAVELPAAAEGAQVVADHQDDQDGDEEDLRDAEDAVAAQALERGRHVGGVDLEPVGAARPERVEAAEDVERAEGDDQGRHLRHRHDRAVEQAAHRAHRRAGEEHHDHGESGGVHQQRAGGVRREPEDRAHREV